MVQQHTAAAAAAMAAQNTKTMVRQHTAAVAAARVHLSGRHTQGKSESPEHQRETLNQ